MMTVAAVRVVRRIRYERPVTMILSGYDMYGCCFGSRADSNASVRFLQAGSVQESLQQVTSEIAKNYLGSVTTDDPFETLGALFTALTLGRRTGAQMSGSSIAVSPGSTVTSRRRNMLVDEVTPEIRIPDDFGSKCEAAGSFKCPSPLEVSISYFADSSYLSNGLGSRAFQNAVASFQTLGVEMVPTAELVTGVFTVAMPNKKGQDLEGNMGITMPLDKDMHNSDHMLFCAVMDYRNYEPQVVGKASDVGDDMLCRCSASLLGEYFCIQANITDPEMPTSPSSQWEADKAPTGGNLISSSSTWDVDFDTVDKAKLAADVKTELAKKLDVPSSTIYITSIKEGSVEVSYSVEVTTKAQGDKVLASIESQGKSLLSGISYGEPAEVGSVEKTGSLFADDSGDGGGPPISIIAGAAAGVIALCVIVGVAIFIYRRKSEKVATDA